MGNVGALRHVRLVALIGGAAALTIGAVGVAAQASATTTPTGTEPGGAESAGTATMSSEPMGSMAMTPGELTVVGSGEAASPAAEAFCAAAVSAQAAAYSAEMADPATLEAAFSAFLDAAPDDIRPAAQTVVETDQSDPAFEAAFVEVIDWMRANCGYSEMDTEGGDYYFTGVPMEMPAGPMIVSLANVGSELHVIDFARVNDDVTLTAEEILALPEEEALASVELLGGAFALPGTSGFTVVDLPPGRYLAVCPIPQGLTPEMAAQMPPEGGSMPMGSMPMGSMPMDSMPMDSMPMDSMPMNSMPMNSMPMDSMPMGPMPMGSMAPGGGGGELGPPHFVLGMWQEIIVT